MFSFVFSCIKIEIRLPTFKRFPFSNGMDKKHFKKIPKET